nr:unnamed protein product [Callosobruchus chinensis]
MQHKCDFSYPKIGDPKVVDNCRQISLISSIAKLLERYIYDNIASFAQKHQLSTIRIPTWLSEKKSVETATCHYMDYIYNHLDSGEYVVSLQFDLMKAFDSVSNIHLENKLEALGIRGVALKWCISQQQKMQVKMRMAQSMIKDIII